MKLPPRDGIPLAAKAGRTLLKSGTIGTAFHFPHCTNRNGSIPFHLGWLPCLVLMVLNACKAPSQLYNPRQTFSKASLLQDFDLLQAILEERHPGLYWYTPKPTMDQIFEKERRQIKAGFTESEFRKHLTRVVTQIQCGHTTILPSSNFIKYMDTAKVSSFFPLYFKIWKDTAVITYNLFKTDLKLKRGVQVDSINGQPMASILDTMYSYLPADGNNVFFRNQRLSTGAYFGLLYQWIFGPADSFRMSYRDDKGASQQAVVANFKPPKLDSLAKVKARAKPKKMPSRKEKLARERSLKIDTSGRFALMDLNSFSEKAELRKFFRQSFRELDHKKIPYLILDLRSNGGGRVALSNVLVRYLSHKPFKLADSLYAVADRSKYSRYIQNDVGLKWFIRLFTKKEAPHQFHYRYFETHYWKPKKKHGYNGQVILLSGGASFSATALAIGVLKDQPHVKLLGEPTGGAAYGNTAMLIPDITLPQTKIKVRLPLFRMVVRRDAPQNGQGIQPDIFVGPSREAIQKGIDFKLDSARAWILAQPQP